jgi:hypothetical protein
LNRGLLGGFLTPSFIPGEIKFKEASSYGGEIRFEALLHFSP